MSLNFPSSRYRRQSSIQYVSPARSQRLRVNKQRGSRNTRAVVVDVDRGWIHESCSEISRGGKEGGKGGRGTKERWSGVSGPR